MSEKEARGRAHGGGRRRVREEGRGHGGPSAACLGQRPGASHPLHSSKRATHTIYNWAVIWALARMWNMSQGEVSTHGSDRSKQQFLSGNIRAH